MCVRDIIYDTHLILRQITFMRIIDGLRIEKRSLDGAAQRLIKKTEARGLMVTNHNKTKHT